MFGLAVIASCLLLVSASDFIDHDSHLLYCPIKSLTDFQALKALEELGADIDIFEERIPASKATFVHVLADGLTSATLMSRNGCFEDKAQSIVHRLLTPHTGPEDPKTREKRLGDSFHDEYRSYADILAQLDFYEQHYPDLVKKKISIGNSHEHRTLPVVHITAAPLGTKPVIWIQAGQHAREWIATAATMYVIDAILQGYKNGDESITAMLNSFEFAILPLVNPDGYEYTRNHNRMHRKNRRSPYGVDLNRNWDFKWGEIGASKNPRTDVYSGTGPASEPEVRSVQNYVLSLRNRVMAFDVHSYGQLVLRNYGWTRSLSPIESVTSPMSSDMVARMSQIDGRTYKAMLSAGLYPTSGGADDWFYVKAGVAGFTLELRDHGESGFTLGPEHIRPTGREMLAGIQTAVKYVKQLSHHMNLPNPEIVSQLK